MMSSRAIEQPNVLVVEGRDDFQFFLALVQYLKISNVQIYELGGEDKLEAQLAALKNMSGFSDVETLGIVRDADGDTKAAFDSIGSALKNANLSLPLKQLGFSVGEPRVMVMIMPPDSSMGSNNALEDLILASVQDDPVIPCVNEYFECVRKQGIAPKTEHLSKAQARVFMEAHYEAQIHVFVAAKNIDETQATGRDRKRRYLSDLYRMTWWSWDNPAFDQVKEFLHQLAGDTSAG